LSLEANSPQFAPTRWTLVLRARGETAEARVALGELCEAYYEPVMQFLQREGRTQDDARELTQEFFARVLSGSGFDGADPGRGRFRSYLLGGLRHFLADQRKRESRLKRGGRRCVESLDVAEPDDGSPSREVSDPSWPTAEALFDRQWALAIVGRALARVEEEFSTGGKRDQFVTLKPWLMGDTAMISQSEAARHLGMSEGALKVAVHRLRKRFREAVRAEIAETVPDQSLIEEEMQHLIAALT
jgi:RNA polymerase sigma factor (sigma-70 family)